MSRTWLGLERPGAAIALVAVLAGAALFAGGCWDRQEIERLSFVVGAELDVTEDGEYAVTYQVVIPVQEETGGGQAGPLGADVPLTVTHTGRTIGQAHRRHAQTTPRRLFLGHLQAVILGERITETGLAQALDFLERSLEVRRTNRVFVRRDPERPLAVRTALQTLSARDLRELSDVALAEGTVPVTILGDFLEGIFQPGLEAVAPGVRIVEGDLHPAQGERGGELRLTETAVFRGSSLAGWLDEDETQGFLWTRDQNFNRAIQDLADPDVGEFAFQVRSSISRTESLVTPQGPRVTVTVELTADLIEASPRADVSLEAFQHLATLALERAVTGRMLAAVAKAQELGSDIFGFGQQYMRHHPDYWREVGNDWPAVFQELEVRVEVQPVLRDPGTILEPR